jgi:hypothetical protein
VDGISELAKMLKERENKNFQGITRGKVISPSPIVIKLGDKIILSTAKSNLIISETIKNKVLNAALNAGDEIILIPTADGQVFYAIDKAVKE